MRNNMTQFTLKLSRERIQLLLSNKKGEFEEIGSADPNEQNITNSLQILRNQVNALSDNNPLIDVMLPDELILIQNLTIDSIVSPISKMRATELVANACELNQDEVNISLGSPTSHRTQPVAAVTTKTLDETRYFLNNAGFKTRRFTASKPINGFPANPIFLEDPTPQQSLMNTKNAVISGISICTVFLFVTAVSFAVKPSQQPKVSDQISSNVTAALSTTTLSLDASNTRKPAFSVRSNSISNIINRHLLNTPLLLNASFQPTPLEPNRVLNKTILYPQFFKTQSSNQNILISKTPRSLMINNSADQNKTALNSSSLDYKLSNFKRAPAHSRYLSLHILKSTVQTDYQKIIKPNLRLVGESIQIGTLKAIHAPADQTNKDFIIMESFPPPRFISLASVDPRYLKRSFPNPQGLNTKMDATLKNYPALPNQSATKLSNAEQLLNHTSLSTNLIKHSVSSLNDFKLTPEQILESEQYMPLVRPALISKINVLFEPTLSSGAVTLSAEPLLRPELVLTLSRLNPNKVKIVAKATKQPSFPRRASVENNATITNIIELNRTNLIGVFGTELNAIALIRLASGRVIKVKVGDRFDGWKVLTIYKDKIELANGKKQETLRLPG